MISATVPPLTPGMISTTPIRAPRMKSRKVRAGFNCVLGFAALRPAGCAGYALAGRNAARRACRPGAAVVQWRDHHGDPAAMPRLLPAAFAALAALLTPPAAHAADATVLECGALFDSRSGRMLGPHAVMVRDGRIESVTAGAAAAAPGADRVDLTGHACMPGWTDLHVHLGS